MTRLFRALAVIALIPVSFFTYRAVIYHQARRATLPVIADLRGKVGSISAPLGGTDYQVSLRGVTPTRAEIDRLVVVNDLAAGWNSVRLSLDDTQITPEHRRHLQEL